MRVAILTLGCKVNQAEMSEVEGRLRGQGHEIVGLDDRPEVCVVNTCTVTSKSDYQSRQLIRRAGRTGAKVIATGCYAEMNTDEVSGMDGVGEVVANPDKSNIIKLIYSNSKSNILGQGDGRTRYFLKVQDGCNNSCSYCIVHVARGPSRSVNPQEIIDKINLALENGFKEVVLTGIHLGQYGADMPGDSSISSLVAMVLDNTSLERLRLSSLEISEIDDNLLDLFDNPRLMPHFHIPLQSGDDKVLRLMNRGYDTATFRERVLEIRRRLPNAAIGTDIIAGFPQESERAFRGTLELVEGLPFTYMHVFPYSSRPGTPAAEMLDLVGDAERKTRAARLRELSEQKRNEFMESQIGRSLDVLVEDSVGEGQYRGTSCNYLKVYISSEVHITGNVVPVSVVGIKGHRLAGVPLKPVEPIDSKV